MNTRALAVAVTRPSSGPGVRRCTSVSTAISAAGSPTPIAAAHAHATGSCGTARSATATASRPMPYPANRRAPSRRRPGPESSPTVTDPAPCTAYSTPAYAGEWPRPSTTAYVSAPLTPAHSMVTPPARTSGRSAGSPHRCRTPSAVALRPPSRAGAGRSSRTRSDTYTSAAARKLAASRTATPGPPYAV